MHISYYVLFQGSLLQRDIKGIQETQTKNLDTKKVTVTYVVMILSFLCRESSQMLKRLAISFNGNCKLISDERELVSSSSIQFLDISPV